MTEREQAIPFLVIADVLFTCLVVTTELLFSEHSRQSMVQVMISGMRREPCLGWYLLCVGVCGVLCVWSLIYSDFRQFSFHCMALCCQCSFD